MKKINYFSLIFTLLLTVFAFSNASAQDESEPDDFVKPRKARPFRIMQELGLTREQVQQIRRINQERRPVTQEAARRWRLANRDLDAAIYADEASESEIKELLKTAQSAQAELLKERSLTEYLIRRVLTPEQLVKFRNLRRQLIEERMERRRSVDNSDDSADQPQRRFNRFPRRRNRGQ